MFRLMFLLTIAITVFGCSDVPISTVLNTVESCDAVSVETTNTHYIFNISEISADGTLRVPKACIADAPNAHLPVYMPRDPAKLYEWINGEIQTTSEAAIQRWVRETVTIRATVIRTDATLHLDPVRSDTEPLDVILLENVPTTAVKATSTENTYARTTLSGRIKGGAAEIKHLNWYLYFQGDAGSITRDQTYNFTVRIDAIGMREHPQYATPNNLIYMVLARIIDFTP